MSETEGAGDAKPFGLESDGVGSASAENKTLKTWVLKGTGPGRHGS